MTIVTVFYKNQAVMLAKFVADSNGLTQGQSINEDVLWKVLGENASYNLAICKQMITSNN